MKKIKVAIIGFGHIAKKFHFPNLLNKKIVSNIFLVDIKKFNIKTLKKKIIKTLIKPNKLYKLEKINISIICTPPSIHFQNIVEAIKGNTNIIVEKPFVTKYKDFIKIKNLKKKDKIITCAFHQRFRPVSRKIKQVIEQKLIGKIYFISIKKLNFDGIPKHSPYFSNNKYSCGGPLIDYGSHYFDLVSWYLNFPKIKSLSCYTTNNLTKKDKNKNFIPFGKFDNEEFATGQIQYSNDCNVNFELGYRLNTPKNYTEIIIYGTKGMIKWPTGEIYKIENSILRKKKLTFNNRKLASDEQIKNFVLALQDKKKLLVKFNEIGYNVKLIEELYKVAIKNERSKKYK